MYSIKNKDKIGGFNLNTILIKKGDIADDNT